MTPEIARLLTATRRQITVRATSGGMRIAAVWQVLMPVARHIECVQIRTSGEPGFDDVTILFAETFAGPLNKVLSQFDRMTWVSAADLS